MDKIKNSTCCFGDKERCATYAEEIRAGTITKEGVIVFILLGIAIILQVFQLYMFRKRWKIGTAPWKRHRMESQNSGRDQDVTGSMPKTDYKAPKDEKDSAGDTVLKCVTSNAEVQIHTSRSDLKNTKSDNWENNVKALGYCKQKSTETVYSNNSLVPNSQESTPSTKDKIEKVYDYTTSVMVQGLDRASVPNSSAEDIKQPPVLDHRGRTVREKCPTPCRNQKIKIPPNPIQNKLHRPRSQTGSKRKKKIKSKKVENTEYLDWGTCHTKVVKDTRNLNIGCSLPIPRDRGATRSMSLDVTASRSWNISSDDDSDTDDSKEEFTPQLTWYIQRLKEKHPYILQRSKTGCMGRKRPCDPRENKTLGSKSSQSLGVMFILDKNKSVSVEDDLEKRSSADYLAIIDTKRHNEQSTILEEREIQSETVSEENLDDAQGQITVIESTLKSDRTSGKEAPTAEVVTYVNEEVVYMTDCNLVHERTGSTVVNIQDSGELLNYTEEKSEMFTIV
ncbi:uncharacterized protein LOC134255784 isoform X2 [Saccostrea cucullata]|uniref:uncharacterized protein LOC134255784 isoform X2 n=1 Tax=Saccostrea cuccullata TaxID=36930 RepID=UPI002ECFFE44